MRVMPLYLGSAVRGSDVRRPHIIICFFFISTSRPLLLFGWRKKNRMQAIKFIRLVIAITNSQRLMYCSLFQCLACVANRVFFFCAFGFYCRKRIICLALQLSKICSVAKSERAFSCSFFQPDTNHIAAESWLAAHQQCIARS